MGNDKKSLVHPMRNRDVVKALVEARQQFGSERHRDRRKDQPIDNLSLKKPASIKRRKKKDQPQKTSVEALPEGSREMVKDDPPKLAFDEVVKIGQVIEDNAKPPNYFEILDFFGKRGFEFLYTVKNLRETSRTKYIMKVEPSVGIKALERLQYEVAILRELRNLNPTHRRHFVTLISRGQDINFKFAVVDLLGHTLHDIRKEKLRDDFSRATAFRICVQTCEALRDFHSAGFLHRDIKLHNFSIGQAKPTVIYMRGFGITRRFLVMRQGHLCRVKRRTDLHFVGTLKFCAIAAHDGIEQSPKDDVEGWLYMCIDTLKKGALPWERPQSLEELIQLKKDFIANCSASKTEEFYLTTAKCIEKIANYLKQMYFSTDIDYNYLIALFENEAKHTKLDLTGPLDWLVGGGSSENPSSFISPATSKESPFVTIPLIGNEEIPVALEATIGDPIQRLAEDIKRQEMDGDIRVMRSDVAVPYIEKRITSLEQ